MSTVPLERVCPGVENLFPDCAIGPVAGRHAPRKVITLEFVVPTALAIVLAIMLSIGAVYLTEMYLGPIEQAEAHYSAAGRNG
jgi:hypothetical protein